MPFTSSGICDRYLGNTIVGSRERRRLGAVPCHRYFAGPLDRECKIHQARGHLPGTRHHSFLAVVRARGRNHSRWNSISLHSPVPLDLRLTPRLLRRRMPPMAASRADTSPKRVSSTSAIAVTPVAVVVVANVTFSAAIPSSIATTPRANTPTVVFPAITTVARRFLPAMAILQLFLRGRPQDGIVGLVVSRSKSLRRGQASGRLSSAPDNWSYLSHTRPYLLNVHPTHSATPS